MAEGGDVKHFCSEDREHKPSCEYFAGGGQALSPEELEGAVPESPSNQAPLSDKELEGAVPETQAGQPLSPQELEGATPISSDENKYGTTGQQAITALEGAAQGFAGPAATWTETHLLGVKPEDIVGRAQANPWIHGGAEAATLIGGMLTGTGEAGLIAKAGARAAELLKLSGIGAAALKLGIEGMLFTGSDEVTKAMLNQPGSNPSNPVSTALLHVGAGGLLSAASGGIFNLGEGLIGKGLQKLGSEETGAKFQDLLYRIGTNGDALGELGITNKATKLISKVAAGKVALMAEPLIGARGAFAVYDSAAEAMRPTIQKMTGYSANKINPYVTSGIMKVLMENEPYSIPNAIHYATQMWQGAQKARAGIKSCFGPAIGSQIAPPISNAIRDELKSHIEDGQQNQTQEPQNFAEGGIAEAAASSDNFAKAFPEQNVLLHAAKARITGYLNSVRPLPNQQKLPFDKEPSDTSKKRSYDQAIDIALSPLGVLDHINKGTLTPDYMKHYKSLYPEVHDYLSKEMTKQISEAQIKKETPPYQKRLGMSLFMGTNLDSTMSPQAIHAIQMTYAKNQPAPQQGQAPAKNKKATNSLSKISQSHQTDDQSRETRLQNQK